MGWMDWIRKTLRTNRSRDSTIDRYWETEGLCRMETTPQVIVHGISGPMLVSSERKYCVRR
jgi:hypothetical protein